MDMRRPDDPPVDWTLALPRREQWPTGTDSVDLEALGFVGFVPFREFAVSDVPTTRGVYAVVRPTLTAPRCLFAAHAVALGV